MIPIRSLEEICQNLQRGEPVIFPTDTLPALAIKPWDAELIWTLKQRPASKPLILMGADRDQLQLALGLPWKQEWLEEADRVWPGPVTLVLPMPGPLCQALNHTGTSLGLRVPACSMSQALLREAGPLATTSVNRSGEPPAIRAEEACLMFPEIPLLGPLPWPSGSGLPSEVRAWSDGGWSILRSHGAPPS